MDDGSNDDDESDDRKRKVVAKKGNPKRMDDDSEDGDRQRSCSDTWLRCNGLYRVFHPTMSISVQLWIGTGCSTSAGRGAWMETDG
jgi:hypothetical protein